MLRYSDILKAFILCLFAGQVSSASLTVDHLRCEYLVEPMAIHEPAPRLSWIVTADVQDVKQEAFQILVASSAELLSRNEGDLWDSREVPGCQTNQVVYKGQTLQSRQECFWKVRVWDSDQNSSDWSEVATWRMGLLRDHDWQAHWIGFDNRALNRHEELFLPPCPFFRKDIHIDKVAKRAMLYTTALGVYEARINGQKVGEDFLAPGWTDYEKRVYYQAYDVTKMVQEGQNTLGMVLGSGWYAGYLGYSVLVRHPKEYAFYGEVPVFQSQLEVEYTDGSNQIFASDTDWKANTGPILEADILMGETYDARAEFGKWDQPGFDDGDWKVSRRMVGAMGQVESSPGVPLRVIEELKTVEITEPEKGKYVFNFGTNFAGVIRLKTQGPRGAKLTFRYGEMLHPDGRIMTENLRRARATDSYTLRGDADGETWTPKFTYHGFQYVEVSGLTERPDPSMLTGLVISSSTPRTGNISTGNAMVNQLYENIVRTQLANYFDIPTDCPQRDERMGWTGDAQVYIRAASFNHDIAAFHQKWIQDLNDDQLGNGAYPNFAPFPFNRPNTVFSPAWMDAGIICPYVIYQVYGDKRILKKFYPNMQALVDLYKGKSEDFLLPDGAFDEVQPAGGYGDWLNQGDVPTSKMYLANAYWLYDLQIMEEIAHALGKEEDALAYAAMHRSVRNAFTARYLKDGKLVESTQTACAMALSMDLLPSPYRKEVGEQLVELIEANKGYLETGFLGTKHLLEALSKTGHHDVALRLFTNQGFPSWLYEVANGATSIWERWDSYTIEDGFGGAQNTGMNSFSHYAFGAVSEWMFRFLAGIDMSEVGYRKVKICPVPNEQLAPVAASYKSVVGEIKSGWSLAGDDLIMEVTIPVNTTAEVWVPAETLESVVENGEVLGIGGPVHDMDFIEGKVRLEVGSGTYRFISKNGRKLVTKF